MLCPGSSKRKIYYYKIIYHKVSWWCGKKLRVKWPCKLVGVSQGFALGSPLFAINTTSFSTVISLHSFLHHCSKAGTQLYLPYSPDNPIDSSIWALFSDIHTGEGTPPWTKRQFALYNLKNNSGLTWLSMPPRSWSGYCLDCNALLLATLHAQSDPSLSVCPRLF